MKLSSRLAGHFSPAVRKRGQSYYWQGAVRIQHGCGHEVEARVIGAQDYRVNVLWAEPVLSVACDCPYFDSDGACKHVWATLLTAEVERYLSEPATATKVIVKEASSALDHDLDDEPFQLRAPEQPYRPSMAAATPAWKQRVTNIAKLAVSNTPPGESWSAKKQIVYQIDLRASIASGNLILTLGARDQKADGAFSRITALKLKCSQVARLPLAPDREILAAIAGSVEYFGWAGADSYRQVPTSSLLTPPLAAMVVPLVLRTGRAFLKDNTRPDDLQPLAWDEGGAWRFELKIKESQRGGWALNGVLRRAEDRVDVRSPELIGRGLVFTKGLVAPLADDTPAEWISHLRTAGPIEVPHEHGEELLAELLGSPGAPALDVPEELEYQEVKVEPRPFLQISGSTRASTVPGKLHGELAFDYEGSLVPALDPSRGRYKAQGRRFLLRDRHAEQDAAAMLTHIGLKLRRSSLGQPSDGWEMLPGKLPRVVRELLAAGWHVEAEGKLFRRPGGYRMEVTSGVDWFELNGEVNYGKSKARLPELLEALRRGDKMVRLDDGTYGMLPEEWLERTGMFARLGEPQNGHIRFLRNQAGLLDALLAAQPEASCDATFARIRQQLSAFEGVHPAAQPAGFVGQLRDYQRQGLGWIEFLRSFSFGGCLADDMGVGKTAQVLALLETRRELRAAGERLAPSLVVVPKSLVFNWKEEAKRFTPQLRVLDYTGLARIGEDFSAYDVVLTTYGTLRRDASHLKDVQFDYVVLDEAQAVKNASTESAKAVRLLRSEYRLALSGTPVENHLGELFSLFEFLNPGMLSEGGVFKASGAGILNLGGPGRTPDEPARRLLAHALRPFILRRTKEQVARELPPKTEQTVHCEMDLLQRKLYNELRQHYRDALLKRVDKQGMAKSKIQVLEALLRLRQAAACHPGLIDVRRSAEGSAKLDVLLDRLREVLDEGHKALVFSQFTSLLKIVRERLDARGTVYEYLDGATRDRQTRVERFQSDAHCPLFLISLKAGGLGLNLTAAGYVFLLDPWWNPAAESQAVDRAHRIGQTQQVFAYRLITRDTVEEKVLELQKTKRDLADSIINTDNSLLQNLQREDLELLLS